MKGYGVSLLRIAFNVDAEERALVSSLKGSSSKGYHLLYVVTSIMLVFASLLSVGLLVYGFVFGGLVLGNQWWGDGGMTLSLFPSADTSTTMKLGLGMMLVFPTLMILALSAKDSVLDLWAHAVGE